MNKSTLKFVGPGTDGGSRGKPALGVTIRRDAKTGKTSQGVNVRFGEDVLKAARWQLGDKVQFAIDKTASVLVFKRVPTGGFTIAFNGGSKSKRKGEGPGRFRPSALFEELPRMPLNKLTECAWSCEDGMIVCALEHEWL